MFIYAGKYKNEEDFNKALKFFAKTIYNKHIKTRKKMKQKLIEDIKSNPKSFGIEIVKEKTNNNVKEKTIKINKKPSLREEYRRRTNRNVNKQK